MGAAGTIETRPVPRIRPIVLRMIIAFAMIVLAAATLALTVSLAPDRTADEPAAVEPAGSTSRVERKPPGFGQSFTSHQPGVRNPTHFPKRP